MNEIFVNHLVPDGPEPFLAIPGPLNVSLRIHSMYPRSRVYSSSKNVSGFESDSRLIGAKIEIFPKKQFKGKLSTGFSYHLVKAVAFLPKFSFLHIHLSRSVTSAILSLVLLFRRDLTFVVQTHGSVKFSSHVGKRLFDFFFTQIFLKRSNDVIALNSVEVFHLTRIGCDSNKVVVIPNSIAPISVDEQYSIDNYSSDKISVLFVGHLRPSKQVMRFFEIAMLEKYKSLEFKIAGPDGGDLAQLQREIFELQPKNVKYLGSLCWDDLSKTYLTSDIILSPALDAPFDLSFLDGVARGCIGVASREFNNWQELLDAGVFIGDNTSISCLEIQLDAALDLLARSDFKRQNISKPILTRFSQSSVQELWKKIYLKNQSAHKL